jgi:microcompartment protein CcmL/EutN
MQMQMSGATSAQMGAAMTMMQTKLDRHHVVDHVEDNIDTLLARLEGQVGKKVKILTEEEEALEQLRQEEQAAKIKEEMDKIKHEKQRLNQDKEHIEN